MLKEAILIQLIKVQFRFTELIDFIDPDLGSGVINYVVPKGA
jgi:hypothetical protein